jgi:hypothetical protein
MENPAARGPAEKLVRDVLDEFFRNQDRKITDPEKVICGLSLERRITDALREAGLMKEDFSKVTRFEVINHAGRVLEVFPQPRSLVAYRVSVELSLEDDDRTLKVFLNDA